MKSRNWTKQGLFTLILAIFFNVLSQFLFAQTTNVTATVKDSSGKPLPFVSVKVKESNIGISTDSLGIFSIAVRENATLIISSVGFEEKSVKVTSNFNPIIFLKADHATLQDVTVVNSSENHQSEAQNAQDVGTILSDFTRAQDITSGPTVREGIRSVNGGPPEAYHNFSNAPTGTFYTGSFLPVFNHKESTKGSRYFFEKWVKGQAVNSNNYVIKKDNLFFNYDKLGSNLLVTQDKKNAVEITKQDVKTFTLYGDDQEITFERVPLIDSSVFLQQLVKNDKGFSLYKSVNTKFIKSNYHTDGMVESGNPYDEYVDEYSYYVVLKGDRGYKKVELKKKSIKEALSAAGEKTDKYFKENKEDVLNEGFLTGLIAYLNE